MKPLKAILVMGCMFLLANIVTAQVDPRADIRGLLDRGNCESAQEYYNDALKYGLITSHDYDLEKEIAICLAIRQQEKDFTDMVASYEQAIKELQVADSAQYAGMKAVYEALLSGDCDKAQQKYMDWYAVSGYDDKGIEDHIKQCWKQKAQGEEPQTAEEVGQVGNLEYHVYLKGTKMAWKAANDGAKALDVGGHSDWRIPTVAELQIVLQQMDEKSYKFVDNGHWSSEMELHKDGSGRCYYVYHRTDVNHYYVENKTPTGLCYCILVRTKK